VLRSSWLAEYFQQLTASFSLLAFFSHTSAFVFSGLQPLLSKQGGWAWSARTVVSEGAGAMADAL
jgi:hypothetical protein